MKWYSVKEYYPPISTECLIRTENSYFYVARLETFETPNVWIHDYDCEECKDSSYESIYGVTHFCLIEPAQIGDENVTSTIRTIRTKIPC